MAQDTLNNVAVQRSADQAIVMGLNDTRRFQPFEPFDASFFYIARVLPTGRAFGRSPGQAPTITSTDRIPLPWP